MKRERERERDSMQFSRVAMHSARKNTGGEERAVAPRRNKQDKEEKEEEEEETVGLRASPARVGAYIDHERVHDILEYIIRGL